MGEKFPPGGTIFHLFRGLFQIASSSSGFVNTDTYSLWINNIFLPHLHNLRQKTGYTGPAVMILDGYLPIDV